MLRRWFTAFLRFVRYITTARDNQSPSWTRIFMIAGSLVFLGKAIESPFDPRSYGEGFGLMITGFALALRVGGPMNAGNDPVPPSVETT